MLTDKPAQDDYFAYDGEFCQMYLQLWRSADPTERAALLTRDAEITEHKARLHTAAFGPDPIPGDGVDLSESLTLTARLLRIIAHAERCRAADVAYAILHNEDDLEWCVLAELRAFARGGRRRPLLRKMWRAWTPLVGGQAVEAIARMPVGRPRWWSLRPLMHRVIHGTNA
jgi:hypothetical protein